VYYKSWAEEMEGLGYIKTIIGKAEVRRLESGRWRSAYVGMKIKVDWEIRTHLESTLELSFKNGSIVKLGENSIVTISALLTNSILKRTSDQSKKDSSNVIPVTEK
jgi:hypothetical protein